MALTSPLLSNWKDDLNNGNDGRFKAELHPDSSLSAQLITLMSSLCTSASIQIWSSATAFVCRSNQTSHQWAQRSTYQQHAIPPLVSTWALLDLISHPYQQQHPGPTLEQTHCKQRWVDSIFTPRPSRLLPTSEAMTTKHCQTNRPSQSKAARVV